jgi:hypothetical protein
MASGACSSHLEGAMVNGLRPPKGPRNAGACGWHLKLKLRVRLFFGDDWTETTQGLDGRQLGLWLPP